MRGEFTAENCQIVESFSVQLIIDDRSENRDHKTVLVLLSLMQVPDHQGVNLPVLGVFDVDLEHVHELFVDGVGGWVLHRKFRVAVVSKQPLQSLVLFLGSFIDTPKEKKNLDLHYQTI